MKQQILMIHGGNSFSCYEDFLEHLKTCRIDDPLLKEPKKRWRNSLQSELGEQYDVYMPTMPNRENARYEEWKIWFERYLHFLQDGAILIGHSQGGYFLAKYLTENTLSVRLLAVYFVAAPIEPGEFGREDGGDFSFALEKLPSLMNSSDHVIIMHSQDDPIVPFSHAESYKKAIQGAELCAFKDRGHFIGESFPELIAHIRDLKH